MDVLAAVVVPYVRSVTLFFVLAYLYSIPSVEKVTGRAAAACAVTGSSSTHRHRHSARPDSRFQILMFNILLSKAHSAFGAPKAVVRTRTTMFFVRPPNLTAARDRL